MANTTDLAPRRRTRTAGHIVAIVVGCLLLLPGLGMVTGGGALAIGQALTTDGDGYFRFTLDRVETDGVAVATDELWIDDVEGDAGPWLLDWLDVDLRLRVDGAASSGDVFVGIARSSDVRQYLDGAAFSEVVEVNDRAPVYRRVNGSESVAAPLDQDIWAASATGTGEQELIWQTRGGRWSVVVMNSDGSSPVAADVEVGVKSGAVTPVAVGMLVLGGIVVAAAVALLVVGGRGRRTPDAPQTGGPDRPDQPAAVVGSTELPSPSTATAVQLDDDVRGRTPVG